MLCTMSVYAMYAVRAKSHSVSSVCVLMIIVLPESTHLFIIITIIIIMCV